MTSSAAAKATEFICRLTEYAQSAQDLDLYTPVTLPPCRRFIARNGTQLAMFLHREALLRGTLQDEITRHRTGTLSGKPGIVR